MASRSVSNARVITVTSADIYGVVDSKDLPLSEEAPLRPVSPYSASKAAADLLALQAYLLVLAAAHYEADYGESSLVKIWSERLTGLIPSTSPLLEQVAVV